MRTVLSEPEKLAQSQNFGQDFDELLQFLPGIAIASTDLSLINLFFCE